MWFWAREIFLWTDPVLFIVTDDGGDDDDDKSKYLWQPTWITNTAFWSIMVFSVYSSGEKKKVEHHSDLNVLLIDWRYLLFYKQPKVANISNAPFSSYFPHNINPVRWVKQKESDWSSGEI